MPTSTLVGARRFPNNRLKTPKGIGYSILKGPTFGANMHGPMTATGYYMVAVNDIKKFCQEIMPTPTRKDGFVYLKPSASLNVPKFLSPASVQVDSFNDERPLDPFLTDTGGPKTRLRDLRPGLDNAYEPDCYVTVQYQSAIDNYYEGAGITAPSERSSARPIEILEPSIDVNCEALSITTGPRIQQGEGPSELKPFSVNTAPIAKLLPITMLSYRWPWAIYPDWNSIFTQLGTVNNTGIDWLFNAEAETVLFLGVSGKLDFRHANFDSPLKVWTLDYKFARRRIIDLNAGARVMGWNYVFNPSKGEWVRLVANGLPLYKTGSGLWFDLFKCELTAAEKAAAAAAPPAP